MTILVKRAIKELAKYEGKSMNVSKDFFEAFEEEALSILKKACKRAQWNGRNTLMRKDV